MVTCLLTLHHTLSGASKTSATSWSASSSCVLDFEMKSVLTINTSELCCAHDLSAPWGVGLKSVCSRHQFNKVYMLCGSADLVL